MNIQIERGTADHAASLAEMVKELLDEINQVTVEKHFTIDLKEAEARARNFLAYDAYNAFFAKEVGRSKNLGFISLYESYGLYAEGTFGTISELYVRPDYRSQGIGQRLLVHASHFGRTKGWTRLEVTTPPLPFFQRTLQFYEKSGFTQTGGKKLRSVLAAKQ